ncbi:hypothetical protein K6Y31_07320 [Motilimonas cestriensis]|uniref:Right handed beta helix domain-containing protein n=1 Tax=Motilimonas cestriensis TaxID=2742685 RepID=A0ABS8W6J0_9GAMM|nr:hypothetical protein [Motilimonas cestriensis]MCE2594622.1 hypothetical protein [Motilimonas cestriensis]
MRLFISLFLLLASLSTWAAPAPHLAFSDLVSGPNAGLGDGLGEGAIVTVWGYRLGDNQGTVSIVDQQGQSHPAAHIYYWKKADGQQPCGPADLWTSHQLYEVAFSIPTSVGLGEASIRLVDEAGISSDNTLPFTVREGNIYHVKAGGNNQNSGSFDDPFQVINGMTYGARAPGNRLLQAGDIAYSHGVQEIQEQHPLSGGQSLGAGLWLVGLEGTQEKQIAIASYPNTQALASGPMRGVYPYLSRGIVISKYKVLAGNQVDMGKGAPYQSVSNPQNSTSQLSTNQWGRAVGNAIGERDGMCSNGWSGAIVGGGASNDNFKALGNQITDIGCDQTSHFQHTTYLTIRTPAEGNEPITGWEFGWNHLNDNKAKFGLHFYDQLNYGYDLCRGFKPGSVLKAHNNYIINQKGSGINIHTYSRTYTDSNGVQQRPACWEVDAQVYNNVIINAGLGPVAEENNGTSPYGITLGGGIKGHFDVYNNTLYDVSDESSRTYIRGGKPSHVEPKAISMGTDQGATFSVSNNVIRVSHPMPYLTYGKRGDAPSWIKVSNNLLYNTTSDSWSDKDRTHFTEWLDSSDEMADPQIASLTPASLEQTSPALTGGDDSVSLSHDFLGQPVGSPIHRGAFASFVLAQPNPPKQVRVTKL